MITSHSMSAKDIAIQFGLYRPLRKLDTLLHPWIRRRLAEERAFYRALLPEHALCFDVGANIGERSEILLSLGHRVIAFEPNPAMWRELLCRCPGLVLKTEALGRAPSQATLYAPAGARHSMASLDPQWSETTLADIGRAPVADESTHVYPVQVSTLDTAIAEHGRPHYIKIDVEGWEPEVLRGLSQSVPLLSFEMHASPRGVSRATECLAHLQQLGFTAINATPAEGCRFLFPEWQRIDGFLPGSVSFPGEPYGDCYVRL